MRRNTRNQPYLAIAITLLLLILIGCGGKGGGGTGGSGGGSGGDGRGRTALPAGLNLPLNTLKASSSLADASVQSDGTFTASVLSNKPQLVTIDNAQGDPVLLGWVGTGHPDVDVKSTAEVLLYFGAGLFLLPEDGQTVAVRDLKDTQQAIDLADAIAAEYAGGATSLDDMKEAIKPRLEEAIDSLLASRGLLIQPTEPRSGLQVLRAEGDSAIQIKNAYRRRAIAHIERMSYDDENGNTTPSPERVAVVDVSPTAHFNSLIGGLIDILGTGQMPYAPVTTAAIPIPLTPEGASSTKYRVTAVGLGSSDGDWDLTDEVEQASYRKVVARTLIADLFLPMIVNLAAPIALDGLEERINIVLATEVYQSAVNALFDVLPGVLDKARTGDVKGAMVDIYKAFATSPGLQLAVLALVHDIISSGYGQEIAEQFMTKVYALFDGMGGLDKFLTVADSVVQVVSIAASRSADVFEIDTTGAKVTLTPDELTIFPTSPLTTFEAIVQNRDPNIAYRYHWKSGGNGRVSSGGQFAMDIETDSEFAVFSPDVGFRGDTSLSVEVFYMEGANHVRVGVDQARIEVSNTRAVLNPRRSSLLHGESQNISVTLLPPDAASGTVWYRFNGTTNYGEFNEPLGEWTRDGRLTYTARSTDGVDSISVEVAENIDGQLVTLARDEGEIRVETRHSIIFGSYQTMQRIENGRHATLATVIIPKAEGATHYQLRAYGGNDPYYYHYSINFSSPFHHDWGADQGSVWWQGISGVWGPESGAGQAISYMDGRFASGWIWEVEVTY
ncbi:MAG: hypothetical protein M9921_07180 [Fimbriimonadaceae bacterium]|nr:hypothetical protein [Fimbriimonadaceae bacterium]